MVGPVPTHQTRAPLHGHFRSWDPEAGKSSFQSAGDGKDVMLSSQYQLFRKTLKENTGVLKIIPALSDTKG